MDWSIHQVARLAGTTSRTLRHDDAAAVRRLQGVLLLRELGLGMDAVTTGTR